MRDINVCRVLSCRVCLGQLCSLGGDVFPDDPARSMFCQRMFNGLLALQRSSIAATMFSLESAVASLARDAGALAEAAGNETQDICRVRPPPFFVTRIAPV